ncbi:MAG: alpha/beta fold hydrolase [Candidatus Hodarchaeota archaeon]
MSEVETGLYLGKIPHAKAGSGDLDVIMFPGADNLLGWGGETTCRLMFYKFLPERYREKCTLHVLGYQRDLPENATTETMARDYGEAVKKEIRPGIIFGGSFGGFLAIPFASLYPELTKKLLLANAAYTVSESGKQWALRLIELAGKGEFYKFEKEINYLYNTLFFRGLMNFYTWKGRRKDKNKPYSYPISTFITAFKDVLARPLERKEHLHKIKASTLVFGGTKDLVFSEDIFRETAELIPNAELKLVKGGHMAAVEKPFAFRKVFLRVLDDLFEES